MVGGLRRELRTELLLPSVAAHKQHQAAGNLQGQRVAVVFLHQRQRKIGAGRDAGARPDIAILGEDTVTIHRNAWMTPGQHIRERPVCGCSSSVEDSGGSQSEGSSAYRSNATHISRA